MEGSGNRSLNRISSTLNEQLDISINVSDADRTQCVRSRSHMPRWKEGRRWLSNTWAEKPPSVMRETIGGEWASFFLFVFWEKTILHISKSIFLCARMNGARWQQKAPQKRAGLASPSIGQERSFFIQKKFVNVTWWQLVAHVVAISVVLCGRMCTRNSIGPIFIHLTTSALLMPLYTEVMTMYYTDLKLAKVPSVSNRLTCVPSQQSETVYYG